MTISLFYDYYYYYLRNFKIPENFFFKCVKVHMWVYHVIKSETL